MPFTILDANDRTELMIVEIGANHIGEIDTCAEFRTRIMVLITNIGKAHLEGFGSLEGVIQAKRELYIYLDSKQGTIIYNDSNRLLSELAGELSCKIIPYSRPDEDLILKESGEEGNIVFDLQYGDY